MKTTEQIVLEAGGINNLEMFSAISQFNGNAIDQLAVVMAPERATEVVVVRAYRRTIARSGGSTYDFDWNDTDGGQNNGGGGGGDEMWTPIVETNTYANRANYYCSLHNTPSIGTKTNFFAAASRVMKTYSRLDSLSDSPSGIPGDAPSWRLLRYNRSISEFLRNIANPEIANRIASNAPPFAGMTERQRDVALVEYEKSLLQAYLDSLEQVNPVDYEDFVDSMNVWLSRTSSLNSFWGGDFGRLLDNIGFENDFRAALDLAEDRAGRNLNFRNKADRILLGVAVIDGVVEDKVAGRSVC